MACQRQIHNVDRQLTRNARGYKGSIADYLSYVYSLLWADIGEFCHCGTLLAPARDFECTCGNREEVPWTCSTIM